MHLGHFLGDEAKGNGLSRIIRFLITEADRLEYKKHFAGHRDAAAGLLADGRVEDAAGVVKERASTDGGIEVAGGVIGERFSTGGGAQVAGSVAKKRLKSISGVVVTGSVAKERLKTVSRVIVASGVGS